MAQPSTLAMDLQTLRTNVKDFMQELRTDYRGRTLHVWMEPSSGDVAVTADTILSRVTAAANTFVWARMDELEAKYDKGGPSCQCEAITAAATEVMREGMEWFKKDIDGLCLMEGGYYALPTDSTLSDRAQLKIKAVRNKITDILHDYCSDLHIIILLHNFDTPNENKDMVDFPRGNLDSVLEGVFREAVKLWQAHTEDEFFYLLASTIKQVRDQHVAEFKTMVANAVVEREKRARVAKPTVEAKARTDGTRAEVEAKAYEAGDEDEIMAEPVEDVKR